MSLYIKYTITIFDIYVKTEQKLTWLDLDTLLDAIFDWAVSPTSVTYV